MSAIDRLLIGCLRPWDIPLLTQQYAKVKRRFPEALPCFERALAAYEVTLAEEPGNPAAWMGKAHILVLSLTPLLLRVRDASLAKAFLKGFTAGALGPSQRLSSLGWRPSPIFLPL